MWLATPKFSVLLQKFHCTKAAREGRGVSTPLQAGPGDGTAAGTAAGAGQLSRVAVILCTNS